MAPRDRESIRKVAISGLDCRFGRPRPSGLDGGALAPVGSRHAQPVNHGTSLSDPAATLATVSFHKVEHLCQVPLDGSDALLAQTCSASWRHEVGPPTDEGWTAGPGSGARTCSLRRNG